MSGYTPPRSTVERIDEAIHEQFTRYGLETDDETILVQMGLTRVWLGLPREADDFLLQRIAAVRRLESADATIEAPETLITGPGPNDKGYPSRAQVEAAMAAGLRGYGRLAKSFGTTPTTIRRRLGKDTGWK